MNRNHRRTHQSIDGVFDHSKPLTNFGTTKSYRPQKPGNFKQPAGFNSIRRSPIGIKPPVVGLPLHQPPKQSRFKRHKNGSLHRPHKSKRFIFRTAGAFSLIVLVGGGLLFGHFYQKLNQIFRGGGSAAALQKNVDPTKLRGEGDGRVNILLLGRGGEGETAPDLTDTILVASIDPVNNLAATLSIPRDMLAKTNNGNSMKLNSVFATAKNNALSDGRSVLASEEAGVKATSEVLENIVGVPLHYYALIDFAGFKKAIDAVGGVDINVTTPLYEQMSFDGRPYTLNVKTGQQHFDGFRALAYVRSRFTSVRGDFDRSERQRLLLGALKDKVLSAGTFANPKKINDIASTLGDHIKTNLTIDDGLRLYSIAKNINNSEVQSLGLADPPQNLITTDFLFGQSVVVPRAGSYAYEAIQSFVRNALKDGFIRRENPSIVLLNGTDRIGLATKKADELKSYGYNVIKVADAPTTNFSSTVIVDLVSGNKKYTLHYLEQRYGVKSTGSLPAGIMADGADFVIILGANTQ